MTQAARITAFVIPEKDSPALRLGDCQAHQISAGVISDGENPLRENRAINVIIAQKAVMLLAKPKKSVDDLIPAAEASGLRIAAVVSQ